MDEAHDALKKWKADHPDWQKTAKKDKKKTSAKKDDNDDDHQEEVEDDDKDVVQGDSKTPKTDKPKRPVNAYIAFSNDVRSKFKEENPDANGKEIVSGDEKS